jgi:hypothetical protein
MMMGKTHIWHEVTSLYPPPPNSNEKTEVESMAWPTCLPKYYEFQLSNLGSP